MNRNTHTNRISFDGFNKSLIRAYSLKHNLKSSEMRNKKNELEFRIQKIMENGITAVCYIVLGVRKLDVHCSWF